MLHRRAPMRSITAAPLRERYARDTSPNDRPPALPDVRAATLRRARMAVASMQPRASLGDRGVTAMRPAQVTDFRAGSRLHAMANFWPVDCFQLILQIFEHGHSM